MPSIDASHNAIRSSQEYPDLPQPPPPAAHHSQPDPARGSPEYGRLPFYRTPSVHPSQRSTQRTPYRLSEGRTIASSPYDISTGNSIRMTIRQPLDTIPIEHYQIYPSMQPPENRRNGPEQGYYHRPEENSSNQLPRAEASTSHGNQAHGNQSAPLPFIRPRLARPQAVSNKGAVSDPGLLTFRMEPNGQSAVVIRHSENLLQPGQVIGYQAELASCFGSKMCPICQEEWIWKIFTPAEMALLDPSGAEWEVARLPCDREESGPDAYFNGHPHYPSISRRVSFTIRSQSEEQPGTPYISDSGQGSRSQARRRHPSWTTLSSSGGGTILRRTRRTSRYVSDTLNALGENSMAALPEEPVDTFTAQLETRDLQALTPDMTLYEPEYWNRYELEVGEEGEGGPISHEQALLTEAPFGNGVGWLHLESYIIPEAWSTTPPAPGEIILEEEASLRQTHINSEQGEEIPGTNISEAIDHSEEISREHDNNVALNELLCQWNTQSTIGDVLRDFHWIIAYVLEGMQQYEAGMAPWPRIPQDFDQRMRSLNVEDTEGNISITSASRRVLSLLESTGIPHPDSERPNATVRISKIPRLAKKEPRVETALENRVNTNQEHGIGKTEPCPPLAGSRKTTLSVGMTNLILSERSDNMTNIDTRLSRTLSRSAMENNERTSTSRSPDKKGGLHSLTIDLGHAGSKIPVLSPRLGEGNLPSMKTETVRRNLTPKSGGSSPMRGQRGKLMAGEMQAPTELHLSRGRKITRGNSPLVSRTNVMPKSVQSKLEIVAHPEKEGEGEGEGEENVSEEITEKEEGNELDKENRRPEA